MTGANYKQILAHRTQTEFIGRCETLEELMAFSTCEGGSGRLLLHAPRTGATELLLQTFDRSFNERSGVFPVYFSFSSRDADLAAAGRRFIREFLSQFVAFKRNDPKLIFTSPSIRELSRSLPAADAQALDEIIAELTGEDRNIDKIDTFERLFSLPIRAAYRGLKPFIMFDAVHEAAFCEGGAELLTSLADAYSKGGFPFIFASRRRLNINFADLKRSQLDILADEKIEDLIDAAAIAKGLSINTSTRDLMALKCNGDLAAIRSLINAAASKGQILESHRSFARIYTDEIFGGAIAETFDLELAAATPSSDAERILISILFDAFDESGKFVSSGVIKNRLGLNDAELSELLERLDLSEFVRVTSGRIEAMSGNRLLADHLKTRYRLEVLNENRTTVYADELTRLLDEAPSEMAESYRRHSALGLKGLMEHFDGRSVPEALLDYGKYKYEYKGLPLEDVRENISAATAKFTLPQIVFSAPTESFYKAIGLLTEVERSAVAIGFEDEGAGKTKRVAWIAVEVDSKLEAVAEDAEFWCDRLEMAAMMCGFDNFRIWLVAPEGFDEEALEIIAERNGFGSSRQQVLLLSEYLESEQLSAKREEAESYEIIIPMAEEAEMIAARTLEEIAKRHNISARNINHIKTALVEACINAAEHSLSPDKKIYQKFSITKESITVTVANRGVRLADNGLKTGKLGEGKRGWGLELIKKLMDEVKVESVDDGTKIVMTKYLSSD